MMRHGGNRRAFTLTEMMVTVALFSLFSTAVVATLSATLNFWRGSNNRITAEQNVRLAMQYMSLELRQAVVNPNITTGWQSISSSSSPSSSVPLSVPTGILLPNEGNTSSSQLIFQEANTSFYDPTSSTFNADDPRNYQRVRYYCTDGTTKNEFHREVITYTSTGAVSTTTDLVVVTASPPPKGMLSLSCQRIGDNYIRLTVSTMEGECVFTLVNAVVALGE